MHFNVYDKISKYLKYIIIISQYIHTHTHVYIYIYIHILYYCVHTQTIMIYVYVRINMYCSFCQETQPSVCTNAMIIIIIITVQYDVLALVVFHRVISTSLQCADTVESTSTSRLEALFSYVRIEKKKKPHSNAVSIHLQILSLDTFDVLDDTLAKWCLAIAIPTKRSYIDNDTQRPTRVIQDAELI